MEDFMWNTRIVDKEEAVLPKTSIIAQDAII